jgi:hypothetical protein
MRLNAAETPSLYPTGSPDSISVKSTSAKCYFERAMARHSTASEKVRAAAARRGYVPPLDPATVPAEVRAEIAEECGLTRQAVNNALQRQLGARKGRPTSASKGQARSLLETEEVVRWLRAFAKGRPSSAVAALMSAAKAIEQGHIHTWTDLDGNPLD